MDRSLLQLRQRVYKCCWVWGWMVAFGTGIHPCYLWKPNPMPLCNNKVADDGTSAQPLQEGKAMVDSLIKVSRYYNVQYLNVPLNKPPHFSESFVVISFLIIFNNLGTFHYFFCKQTEYYIKKYYDINLSLNIICCHIFSLLRSNANY